jgi:hypothetical protein
MQPVDTQVSFTINTNLVKAATVTGLAVGTCALVIASATAVSTVAMVLFGALAITAAAISIASMTAAFSDQSSTIEGYFGELKSHLKVALPALWQFVAQTFVQALVQGAANGISDRVTSSISGRPVQRFAF